MWWATINCSVMTLIWNQQNLKRHAKKNIIFETQLNTLLQMVLYQKCSAKVDPEDIKSFRLEISSVRDLSVWTVTSLSGGHDPCLGRQPAENVFLAPAMFFTWSTCETFIFTCTMLEHASTWRDTFLSYTAWIFISVGKGEIWHNGIHRKTRKEYESKSYNWYSIPYESFISKAGGLTTSNCLNNTSIVMWRSMARVYKLYQPKIINCM